MKKLIVPGAMLALGLAITGCGEDAARQTGPDALSAPGAVALRTTDEGVAANAASYEITITNLTPATGMGSSQVFSPPVIASHRPSVKMFDVGTIASEPLAKIAEDALNADMVTLLGGLRQVDAVLEGSGVIPPGATETYEFTTTSGFPVLSAVWMLVNTNDAFGGFDSIKLPESGERTFYVGAYDAGSEENTELRSDIPGPCCNGPGVRVPTSEPIRPHAGILGVGDLDPAVYGWEGAVAMVTVRRLAPKYEVTLYNLTAPGAQVFSPPVIATHKPSVHMFQVGEKARPELAQLAEDGMTAPLQSLLAGLTGSVYSAIAGSAPIVPGGMASWEIEAGRGFPALSLAFMLVNTNDAFSGADGIHLPSGGTVEYGLRVYDAGSEENTELASDIPGPCCSGPGVRVPTDGPIAMHPGIQGGADLDPAVYGWDDPAAMLKVTRIR